MSSRRKAVNKSTVVDHLFASSLASRKNQTSIKGQSPASPSLYRKRMTTRNCTEVAKQEVTATIAPQNGSTLLLPATPSRLPPNIGKKRQRQADLSRSQVSPSHQVRMADIFHEAAKKLDVPRSPALSFRSLSLATPEPPAAANTNRSTIPLYTKTPERQYERELSGGSSSSGSGLFLATRHDRQRTNHSYTPIFPHQVFPMLRRSKNRPKDHTPISLRPRPAGIGRVSPLTLHTQVADDIQPGPWAHSSPAVSRSDSNNAAPITKTSPRTATPQWDNCHEVNEWLDQVTSGPLGSLTQPAEQASFIDTQTRTRSTSLTASSGISSIGSRHGYRAVLPTMGNAANSSAERRWTSRNSGALWNSKSELRFASNKENVAPASPRSTIAVSWGSLDSPFQSSSEISLGSPSPSTRPECLLNPTAGALLHPTNSPTRFLCSPPCHPPKPTNTIDSSASLPLPKRRALASPPRRFGQISPTPHSLLQNAPARKKPKLGANGDMHAKSGQNSIQVAAKADRAFFGICPDKEADEILPLSPDVETKRKGNREKRGRFPSYWDADILGVARPGKDNKVDVGVDTGVGPAFVLGDENTAGAPRRKGKMVLGERERQKPNFSVEGAGEGF